MKSKERLERLGPDWPHRTRSEIVQAGDTAFHIQRCGWNDGADRPLVLLLHGSGASLHSFRDLAPLLAERTRVLAIDLPGHGASETPPSAGLSIEGMGKRLSLLLQRLDAKPDFVVGHSAGAALAIGATIDGFIAPRAVVGLNAALQPMQGYAFFSPLAKLLFLNPFVPSVFARLSRRPGSAERLLASTGSTLDARGVDLYRRLFANVEHVYGSLGTMAAWDLERLQRRLPSLKVPLILVTARDDGTVPARDAPAHVDRVRDGRLISLESGGHLLHEVEPDRVAGIVCEVMAQIDSGFGSQSDSRLAEGEC